MIHPLLCLPRTLWGLVALLALVGNPLAAVSVVPPTFTALVGRADTIVRGTVADVHAAQVPTPDGRAVIKTFVIVRVAETAKGLPAPELTLSFLGGTVDGRSLTVGGMPTFRKGDRGWFFIKDNHRVFCPLLFVQHGAYPLVRDPATGTELVTRYNGEPLRDPQEVAHPFGHDHHQATATAPGAPDLTGALSSAQFSAAIRAEWQRLEAVSATLP